MTRRFSLFLIATYLFFACGQKNVPTLKNSTLLSSFIAQSGIKAVQATDDSLISFLNREMQKDILDFQYS
jgi:hypothetical protein